jgi:hypothetical protein
VFKLVNTGKAQRTGQQRKSGQEESEFSSGILLMLSSAELPMDMHDDQICSSLADASRCLPENVQYLVKQIHSSPFVSFLMLRIPSEATRGHGRIN